MMLSRQLLMIGNDYLSPVHSSLSGGAGSGLCSPSGSCAQDPKGALKLEGVHGWGRGKRRDAQVCRMKLSSSAVDNLDLHAINIRDRAFRLYTSSGS